MTDTALTPAAEAAIRGRDYIHANIAHIKHMLENMSRNDSLIRLGLENSLAMFEEQLQRLGPVPLRLETAADVVVARDPLLAENEALRTALAAACADRDHARHTTNSVSYQAFDDIGEEINLQASLYLAAHQPSDNWHVGDPVPGGAE